VYVHLQKEQQRTAGEALSRAVFTQPSVQAKEHLNQVCALDCALGDIE